ncbi:unnamed protein product [Gongylonema pulchrum]|uniref:MAM domain-containing protein n=1 Tax=Gongylonema pulchrum TaxID=637853 RepID=A0A183DN15_9BILA|nr:unnamed protein product [Gongylonema pulchrum]
MPGYGYERMKLKEYLGIEWIENGFDQTDLSQIGPNAKIFGLAKVYQNYPNDLDCTFDDVTKCRWRNARPDESLDSLDFYLFEKIDFTEFPMLQVRPGPSGLRRGKY